MVEAGNLDEAINIYSTLLSEKDLKRIEKRLTLFNLGVIHHQKADPRKALTYWKEAATLPIDEKEALANEEEMAIAAAAFMNLGAHYVLHKEVEKGLGYLQAASELDPDDGEIRYNLAATLATLGRHKDAIKEFEAAEERGVEIAREVIKKMQDGGLVDDDKPSDK